MHCLLQNLHQESGVKKLYKYDIEFVSIIYIIYIASGEFY